jgi:branched-chain amino acid transport system permease protein
MKPMHFAMALLYCHVLRAGGRLYGRFVRLDYFKLVVDTAADIRWQWVFIGTAVVFLFQLLRRCSRRR